MDNENETIDIKPIEATEKATETDMDILHGLTAKFLTEKIKSGKATVQELNAAIKFLKDNNIAADPEASKVLRELQKESKVAAANTPVEALPFPTTNQG